jgi:hypothetical protein
MITPSNIDYKKLAPTATISEAKSTTNLSWHIFDETNGGVQLTMFIDNLTFDVRLELEGTSTLTNDTFNHFVMNSEINMDDSIVFWKEFINLYDKNLVLTSDREFFTFVGLMNQVNNVIKPLLPYQSTSSAKEYNKVWNDNLSAAFEKIDNEASGNFIVEWLTRYDTPVSRQIKNAGFHETLHMLHTLQPDFMKELIGLHHSSDDTPINISKVSDSPLLNLLLITESPMRIQNQLELFSELLTRPIDSDTEK